MIDDRTLMRHASHALLSPLSSILNLTDILLGGIAGPISAQVRKDVEDIAADAGALQQALEIVIDVLRIDGHRLRITPLPLPVAVHRAADLVRRRTRMACTFDILVPEDQSYTPSPHIYPIYPKSFSTSWAASAHIKKPSPAFISFDLNRKLSLAPRFPPMRTATPVTIIN